MIPVHSSSVLIAFILWCSLHTSVSQFMQSSHGTSYKDAFRSGNFSLGLYMVHYIVPLTLFFRVSKLPLGNTGFLAASPLGVISSGSSFGGGMRGEEAAPRQNSTVMMDDVSHVCRLQSVKIYWKFETKYVGIRFHCVSDSGVFHGTFSLGSGLKTFYFLSCYGLVY